MHSPINRKKGPQPSSSMKGSRFTVREHTALSHHVGACNDGGVWTMQGGRKAEWQTRKRDKDCFHIVSGACLTIKCREWRAESRTQVFPSQPDALITMLWSHTGQDQQKSGVVLSLPAERIAWCAG